jgi:hypothetical protein
VALVGRGAQALADDIPQLSSILDHIGVRLGQIEVHSRHAEVLLLHTRGISAKAVAWHYAIARQMVIDLWDQETAAELRSGTITLIRRGWLRAMLSGFKTLPPLTRTLTSCPDLVTARFPRGGDPAQAIDHARWLCAFGRYGRSCALLEHYLQTNRDDGAAHFTLGQMLVDFMNDPQRAADPLRRATELDPNQPIAWTLLGLTLVRLDQGEEA